MSKHLNLVSASPSSLARKFLKSRRDFEIEKKTAAMKWETWKTCVSTDKEMKSPKDWLRIHLRPMCPSMLLAVKPVNGSPGFMLLMFTEMSQDALT